MYVRLILTCLWILFCLYITIAQGLKANVGIKFSAKHTRENSHESTEKEWNISRLDVIYLHRLLNIQA
jgi:hypothetical protein